MGIGEEVGEGVRVGRLVAVGEAVADGVGLAAGMVGLTAWDWQAARKRMLSNEIRVRKMRMDPYFGKYNIRRCWTPVTIGSWNRSGISIQRFDQLRQHFWR